MIEAYGNIWDHEDEYDAIAITTNGYVTKDGLAVMGRGIALQAAQRYPEIRKDFGQALSTYGNHVWGLKYYEMLGDRPWLIMFPVKPAYGPQGEMGWKAKADLALIKQSAHELVECVDKINNMGHVETYVNRILLPRPGCGNGGLKWENVKPIIEPILDDRFTVMENI